MPSTMLPADAIGLPAEPRLTEPFVCAAVYADGLAAIEIASNGNARLTLYVEQRDAYEGRLERIVAARLVIPQAALMDAVSKIIGATADAPPPPAWTAQNVGGRA